MGNIKSSDIENIKNVRSLSEISKENPKEGLLVSLVLVGIIGVTYLVGKKVGYYLSRDGGNKVFIDQIRELQQKVQQQQAKHDAKRIKTLMQLEFHKNMNQELAEEIKNLQKLVQELAEKETQQRHL